MHRQAGLGCGFVHRDFSTLLSLAGIVHAARSIPCAFTGRIGLIAWCAVLEKLFAGFMLLVCVVMLIRLAIGERRRWRLDAALHRAWLRTRRAYASTRLRIVTLYRWRASRKAAAEATEQAIRRARGSSRRDDNVVHPDAFRKPPNDKLH
jgi:hypothetical protein